MSSPAEFAHSLPFWDHLAAHEQTLVADSVRVRRFAVGSVLYGCNTDCLGMIMVMDGRIRTYISSEEGREITLFTLEPGEPCVLSATCVLNQITFDPIMKVQKDATVLVLPSRVFKRLQEENIHVRCFAYELAVRRFSTAIWVIQQILFKGMDARLAEFLLAHTATTGSDSISMSQEEIAVAINSAREVVARMLGHFREDGLVELRRGRVIIKNRAGLASRI